MPTSSLACGRHDWQMVSDGTLVGYFREGAVGGPFLHLLHGNGFCAATWNALTDHIPGHISVLATDIPGHGRSANPWSEHPVWSQLADRLARFVAWKLDSMEQPPESVTGCGHSLGGVLTTMMAARHTGLFDRLLLADPVMMPPALIGLQHSLRWGRLTRLNPLVRKTLKRQSRWPDRDAALRYLKSRSLYKNWEQAALDGFLDDGLRFHEGSLVLACDPMWEARLFGSAPDGFWPGVRQLRLPVLALVATGGFGFIAPAVRYASRLNPGFRHQPFAGSHCFPMEQSEVLAEQLLGWMDVPV